MSWWRFVVRSMLFHWRINTAVALGVMAATAVLTGALLVGDCVRGSLRGLTLDRLGKIDEILVADRFFRSRLSDELAATEAFKRHYESATPVILFPHGTVDRRLPNGDVKRSARILIVGSTEAFWSLGSPEVKPKRQPADDEIVLNETLADDLGITRQDLGDDPPLVTLRFARNQQVAADFAIGKKDGLVASIPRLKVIDIIPTKSLGRFGLQASQGSPRNAYVSLASVQSALEQPDRANAVLIAGKPGKQPPDESASQALSAAIEPNLEDYGFVLKRATAPLVSEGGMPVFDYFSFSSERMILTEETARVARKAFSKYQPREVFTYLANAIGKQPPDEDGKATKDDIPFSMITAIDFTPEFAPVDESGNRLETPLADDEIVLNTWAAQELGAKVGDRIFVTFFMPETTHGKETAQTEEFTLRAILPITKPSVDYRPRRPAVFDKTPTLVNDPDLTPFVPGVTDQDSIGKWNLPFDTSGVRGKDDQYWRSYRTTPKAFISLNRGRDLWASRFGDATSLRIPTANASLEDLEESFLAEARSGSAKFGFELLPAKRRGLEAASGTTPFDALFLSLSFFIIAAALMLVSLLFRLGIEQRAGEVGTLLGIGLRRRLTGKMLVAEGTIVATIGGLFGILAGIGYAWLMVFGLRTVWVGAVVTPFLEFHMTLRSLLIGYASGVAISILTISWSVWRTRKISVRRLLAGDASDASDLVFRRRPWVMVTAGALFGLALLLTILAATILGGESQAGAFVGGGAVLLVAMLLVIWNRLRLGRRGSTASKLSLPSLAARNAGRNPSRSAITIGLVAFASFLIVAMSSFRLSPTDEGVGGFDLMAISSRPIFADLNVPEERYDLLDEDENVLKGGRVLALRQKPGDDASCNNLFQASRPRVLGVPPAMVTYFSGESKHRFKFASSAAETEADEENPWRLLATDSGKEGVVPVIIDKNTAMYALHLYRGIGEEFEVEYETGHPVRFQVVGLLANSVLQGSLLIAEDRFEEIFPRISGYHFFLIRSPEGKTEEVSRVLEDRLSDQGFDVTSTTKELEGLLAVQNTYLLTFQSLGALGLLLGTFGLATVQLRSVLERRRELALMRATGFDRRRLAAMVMMENSLLLLGGLVTGIASALIAVLPHMVFGDASIPLGILMIMMGVILVVGFVSGFAAVRWTLRAPLLAALRGE